MLGCVARHYGNVPALIAGSTVQSLDSGQDIVCCYRQPGQPLDTPLESYHLVSIRLVNTDHFHTW